MAASKRSAPGVKFPEDGSYVLRHPFQHGHHWSNPSRAYRAGEAHTEIYIRVRPGGLDEYAEDHGPLICFLLPAKGDQIRMWSTGLFDLGSKQVDVSCRMV